MTGFVFNTIGILGGNGQPSPSLSHATLYVTSDPGPGPGPGPNDQVPEPSTMLIWLCLAAVMFVWMLRRKKAALAQ